MKKKINVGETMGVKRKIDPLGRIVLPSEFRKELGIKEGEEVEMFLIPDGIYIRAKEN